MSGAGIATRSLRDARLPDRSRNHALESILGSVVPPHHTRARIFRELSGGEDMLP